ncbi:HlyD family efflux transporter periplasmic adaptor subunit [Chitinophaga sp. Mgbs1]|uniref:HlyD family efflux transporter periplasmic adaptor subunit n=1 Tax=Chitinophaga solisilvae TaxID=1233460 RepID=A0A3S1DTC9_9BACT|nr:HlyD family efflux transporter periplasmic adaptor subunit [Chitinophaga solisilvae]
MEHRKKIDEIDIYSDEVKHILQRPDGLMLRWGSTIFFIIVLLLFTACYFIRYPDSIYATVLITTPHPPATIVAKKNGTISRLFVKENQYVKAQEVIGIISNTCNYNDLQTLKKKLASYDPLASPAHTPAFATNLDLGELQPGYMEFVSIQQEYQLQITLQPEQQEILALENSRSEHQQLLNRLSKQKENLEEELSLTDKDLTRNKSLLEMKVISAKEYEDKMKQDLLSKRQLITANVSINNTNIDVIAIGNKLRQLRIAATKNTAVLQQRLTDAYKQLLSSIAAWEEVNLLVSPIPGKVTFFRFWSENQYVKANEDVFTIVPDSQDSVVGKMMMPVLNSGKVQPGNRVIISLNNYPEQEFGTLNGRILHISLVPKGEQYAIEVSLPHQLLTSNKKTLQFRQEMGGKAEIITENRSIFNRIFEKVMNRINRRQAGA